MSQRTKNKRETNIKQKIEKNVSPFQETNRMENAKRHTDTETNTHTHIHIHTQMLHIKAKPWSTNAYANAVYLEKVGPLSLEHCFEVILK